MSKTGEDPPNPAKRPSTPREARLAQALRANLRRRKVGQGDKLAEQPPFED